jgi:hypothetical protein
MKIIPIIVFMTLIISLANADVKNAWPFYSFGPIFPLNETEFLFHKDAEAILCNSLSQNCKLDKGTEDIVPGVKVARNEYLYLVKKLHKDNNEKSPVNGFLVIFHYPYIERGEFKDFRLRKQELQKSFYTDIKGNRIPLESLRFHSKYYENQDPYDDYFATYFRAKSVYPEPDDKVRDYWLNLSGLDSMNNNFWLKLKTKVYNPKYSRIAFIDESKKKDWENSYNFIKSIIPNLDELSGKKLDIYAIGNENQKKNNFFPKFYIES